MVNLSDVTEITDFDQDGLRDIQEFSYGLRFNDKWDAMMDLDGDRVPTLYEVMKGTDPLDVASVPAADLIVDPVAGSADPNDNIYNTIQEAVNQVPANNTLKIIFVKPGVYNESVVTGYKATAFLMADWAGDVRIDGGAGYAMRVNRLSSVSMDGFILSGNGGYVMSATYGTGWSRTTPVILSN